MEIIFYCQACDHAMDSSAFATLTQGRCPQCDSMEGFSTMPKSEVDPFVGATVVNDADFLSQVLDHS